MSIVKFPLQRPRTTNELLTDLLQDEEITEVVVVYKKVTKDADGEDEESMICESTSMSMADLCLAEKTLHININRIVGQDIDFQGYYKV